MNLKAFTLLLLVSFVLLITSCSQSPVFKEHETVYKIGDQEEWASKNWNDKDWRRNIALIPDSQIFWSRTKIDIEKASEPLRTYGLQLEVYGAYEVFWDGVLIGKNGNPGQEENLSREGLLWVTYSIPTDLTDIGEHVLALRLSNYYFPDHVGIWELDIDYYDDLLKEALIQNTYMHIYAGAFFIASLYFLFLFLSHKEAYSTLIFSLCCFLVFTLTVTAFSEVYLPIHYSFHVIRLQIISAFLLGISFLIPFYFSKQFPHPKRKLLLIIYAGILITIFLVKHQAFDFTAVSMGLGMWIFSFGIAGYGAYNKKRGARLTLITLLLTVLIYFVTSFVISLYAGLGLILLSMLYLLTLQRKAERLAYENSLVQSTRLRLQLLKKNIQPHFLMNTLTSLIDWVEESPKKGVLFIEALAKEFDLFSQIEERTLIPITQEIELCRTHLEIMEYRNEVRYIWGQEGINPDEKIPPAILHTLLENGITHSLPTEDNTISFKLVFELNGDYKSYTFLTLAAGVRLSSSREEGTGLKYIKARLTESYDSKWDFTSEPTNDGWKNILKIYV